MVEVGRYEGYENIFERERNVISLSNFEFYYILLLRKLFGKENEINVIELISRSESQIIVQITSNATNSAYTLEMKYSYALICLVWSS